MGNTSTHDEEKWIHMAENLMAISIPNYQYAQFIMETLLDHLL